mmetsp:Transcript_5296/g.14764  ORF Transcript_5296/g.14764 Transcript_5296/m.14764 type:complete len:511 (-) Transcript_5296:475-2007(-)
MPATRSAPRLAHTPAAAASPPTCARATNTAGCKAARLSNAYQPRLGVGPRDRRLKSKVGVSGKRGLWDSGGRRHGVTQSTVGVGAGIATDTLDEESEGWWFGNLLSGRLQGPATPSFLDEKLAEDDPGLNQSLLSKSSLSTVSQLFGQDQWEQHRSMDRYFASVKGIPISCVTRRIMKPFIMVLMVTAGVVLWNGWLAGMLALSLQLKHSLVLAVSPVMHQLLGAAITLLLVFRTNCCHARFAEGRLQFGKVMGCARRWALLASMYLPEHQHDKAVRYIKVWAMVLKSRLRQGRTRADPNDITAYRDDPTKFVHSTLPEEEAQGLMSETNRPLVMLIKMAGLVASTHKSLAIPVHEQFQVVLNDMGSTAAACERILGTPVPLSYTRHTCRSLMLWAFTLPFGLWPMCGPMTFPAVCLITYVLFGIDELASQIEEPFCILPLTPLCQRLQFNVDLIFRLGPSAVVKPPPSPADLQTHAPVNGHHHNNSIPWPGSTMIRPSSARVPPPAAPV